MMAAEEKEQPGPWKQEVWSYRKNIFKEKVDLMQ